MNLKIKIQFDDLRHESSNLIIDKIISNIKENLNTPLYDDSVIEFNLSINNIIDTTEETGLDVEGCVAFRGIEIIEIPEPIYEWLCYDCGKIEKSIVPLGGYIICDECASNIVMEES